MLRKHTWDYLTTTVDTTRNRLRATLERKKEAKLSMEPVVVPIVEDGAAGDVCPADLSAVGYVEPIGFTDPYNVTRAELEVLFRNRSPESFEPEEAKRRPEDYKVLNPCWLAVKTHVLDAIYGLLCPESVVVKVPQTVFMVVNKSGKGYFTRLEIYNPGKTFVTYRIRASICGRYRLTPPAGCLEPGGRTFAYIETEKDSAFPNPRKLHGDNFLVDAVELSKPFQSLCELYVFWKVGGHCGRPTCWRYRTGLLEPTSSLSAYPVMTVYPGNPKYHGFEPPMDRNFKMTVNEDGQSASFTFENRDVDVGHVYNPLMQPEEDRPQNPMTHKEASWLPLAFLKDFLEVLGICYRACRREFRILALVAILAFLYYYCFSA